MILSGSIANEIGRSHLSVGDAGLYAILGYAIVFLGLVLLLKNLCQIPLDISEILEYNSLITDIIP